MTWVPRPGLPNQQCADRAEYALRAAAYATDELDEGVADLVADLLHAAQRGGLDLVELITRGFGYYGACCVEQAHTYADDWEDRLGHPANRPRIEQVLRVCRVPPKFDREIYSMLGVRNDGAV